MERIWRFLGFEDLWTNIYWPIETFAGDFAFQRTYGFNNEAQSYAAYNSRQTLSEPTFNAFKP